MESVETNSLVEVEHMQIPMRDGCRLSARIWMPKSAERQPVPAILEYIPYRKNDMTSARDAIAYPLLARNGYACVRLDTRGSGESQGVLKDEYLQQELDDGVAAIAWIAKQAWCNGNVGMVGMSWGGFNALQIAALQPPALKAVISCASSVDRYADDVHYMGGCLLTDNISWASVMFNRNSCPPDPLRVGEDWKTMWLSRLRESGLWLETWLQHQTRDAYWRHGSVCEDLSRIRCPVYAIDGWADGYINAVFRLLAGLSVPRKGLIGPWGHNYPHLASPGPTIGYVRESLRWWDQWLKGRDTGIMDEPMLRVWLQDSVTPNHSHTARPGRWVAEPEWPSPRIFKSELLLHIDGKLAPDQAKAGSIVVASPLSVGLQGGRWCSYAISGDQPADQSVDDSKSVVFDTAPLTSALDILGEPVVELELESVQPVAMIAVRLNDVAPNGASTRVSYGLFNLTHRESHEHPSHLQPGKRYKVRVPLNHAGHSFAPSHRIRIALSTSYWPMAWAPPNNVKLTIHTGASCLILPVRPLRPEDDHLSEFTSAEVADRVMREQVEEGRNNCQVTDNQVSGRSQLEIFTGAGTVRFPKINLTVKSDCYERYSLQASIPNSQQAEVKWNLSLARDEWQVETKTQTLVTCDDSCFYLEANIQAYEGGELVHGEIWNRTIPRKYL